MEPLSIMIGLRGTPIKDKLLRDFTEIAKLLAKATGKCASSFMSPGKGYKHYYGGVFPEAHVMHFSGVPCYEAGPDNKSHMVYCISDDGLAVHPMGQCPIRLEELKESKKIEPSPLGDDW